jgi:hypothetical protein
MRLRHGDIAVHGLAPGLGLPSGGATTRGWFPATRLVDGSALPSMLDTAVRRWPAPLHVAAALAWKSYTYWVTLPAVLGYAAARRVPLLVARDVLVRFDEGQPFLTVALRPGVRVAVLPSDPLAACPGPGVRVVPDEAALLVAFREAILDRHLDPIVDRIRSTVRVGRRTLLGSLASGVSYGVARAAHVLPDPPVKVAEDLLDALGVADLVTLADDEAGGVTVCRHTCCLAFTLPSPKICSGCPVPQVTVA